MNWFSPFSSGAEAFAERDRLLAEGDTARTNGGRIAKFAPDIDPNSVLFVLSDGAAGKGGSFGFDRPQAEILYRQLGELLAKEDS